MREARYEAKEMEDAVFAASGITIEELRRIGADGTRRLGRLLPEISTSKHDEGVTLQFTLPAGGYATVVLPVLKNDIPVERRNLIRMRRELGLDSIILMSSSIISACVVTWRLFGTD
jgi:tRNA(Glu) U13 pseudouridine synthase TruD